MSDAADFLNFIERRVRIGKGNVFGDCAVKQKVILHHYAEVRTKISQPYRLQVLAVNFDRP